MHAQGSKSKKGAGTGHFQRPQVWGLLWGGPPGHCRTARSPCSAGSFGQEGACRPRQASPLANNAPLDKQLDLSEHEVPTSFTPQDGGQMKYFEKSKSLL